MRDHHRLQQTNGEIGRALLSDLYSRENVVTDTALRGTERLPDMEEFEYQPTLEELSRAIDLNKAKQTTW